MEYYEINNEYISLTELDEIINSRVFLRLSDKAKESIKKCRAYLDEEIGQSDKTYYGINTGFGSLCNTVISKENLGALQKNLVLSHACGTGEEVPKRIIKRMLLLKIIALSKGYSGVQLDTVERLIFMYNENILPVVYRQGSLGASGDLAPLAHLSLPLLGEGQVHMLGAKVHALDFLKKYDLKPLELRSKEGLALLNGTQFMSAYASYSVSQAKKLWKQFNFIASLSLDAYLGRIEPFSENVNKIRKQKGQIEAAREIKNYLRGSELQQVDKEHVQDPYSFRCIPQVHGASKDAIDYCETIVENEINAVTDNPTVFPDEKQIVSAGNFHGQPLALAMDFLAISVAELGSISERRIFKLISGTRALPAFLVAKPGLNSGFMIPQYTAASIVSQNKQLCTPSSIDSIDSSNGQEDHVSMGANAAIKLYQIVTNCYTIQAIELMNATQAIDFRKEKTSPVLEKLRKDYRDFVPFVNEDVYLHPNINKSIQFVRSMKLEDYGK